MVNNALGMQALTDLSSRLKTVDAAFANAIRKQIRAGVLEAGAGVLEAVKARASWSTRIPQATKLTTRFNPKGASIRIIVDHNQAPHARPFELGNKNSYSEAAINRNGGFKIVNGRRYAIERNAYRKIRAAGGAGRTLRHPVWTRGGYTDEPTRPFFFPGIQEQTHSIDLRMETVVLKTALSAGFK